MLDKVSMEMCQKTDNCVFLHGVKRTLPNPIGNLVCRSPSPPVHENLIALLQYAFGQLRTGLDFFYQANSMDKRLR